MLTDNNIGPIKSLTVSCLLYSVGIEHSDDLIEDLKQALEKV